MLSERDLATLRAALLFWSEEITPHEPEIARPYLKPGAEPLTRDELAALRERFEHVVVHSAAGCLSANVPDDATVVCRRFLQAPGGGASAKSS